MDQGGERFQVNIKDKWSILKVESAIRYYETVGSKTIFEI